MAKSYENLNVWKDSITFVKEIYDVTVSFPRTEMFGLVSQIRRAAVSISANIAEGSGRGSKKDYCRFIDIAIGSLNETETHLHISKELRYLSEKEFNRLKADAEKLGFSLGAFRKYLKSRE